MLVKKEMVLGEYDMDYGDWLHKSIFYGCLC